MYMMFKTCILTSQKTPILHYDCQPINVV